MYNQSITENAGPPINTESLFMSTCTQRSFECQYTFPVVKPGGLGVIKLASGSKVRKLDPGRGRWIFQSVKILSMTSFYGM